MRRITAIVAACALALAACGGNDTAQTTTTTEQTTTSPDAATTTTTTPEATTTQRSTTTTAPAMTTEAKSSSPFPGEGDTAFLTSVDVDADDDIARIVWSFEDGVVPSYRVEYVEPPITQSPSGQEMDLQGSAFLQVTVNPGAGVDLSGEEPRETFTGDDRFDAGADGVAELAETEDFEALLSWVVGLEEQYPFSVDASEGELVVEVAIGSTTGGAGEALAALGEDPAECSSPEGYSVSYPASWWANDGSVTDACGLFGPEPIDLEPATDVNAPINVFVDPVPFTVAAEPTETGEELSRAVTLLDGARAVRTVSESGEGLLPEGTESTTYVVDVSSSDGDRTMIMSTADVESYDYERNVAVLDAMARVIDLDIETPDDLVARYMGGGAPFDVTATSRGSEVCLTVSPPGEEACLSAPEDGSVTTATIDGVAVVLAAPDVFAVEATDGISYLPTPIRGSVALGWAIPIDGSAEIVARGWSGDVLSTTEAGG